MIVYPKAKINIGLRIIEKRADGFHNLETFFINAGTTDILEVTESDRVKMNQYGIELDSAPGKNLCVKAYEVMRREFDIPPVEINLFKQIPFGAGLGGGSSDAAGTMIAINRLFSLGLDKEKLASMAAAVGSDCPFFIYSSDLDSSRGEGMIGTGRGELLEPFTAGALEGLEIRIEKPPVHVSTAEAYAGIVPALPANNLRELLSQPVETWRETIVNDFEGHIFEKYPQIREYKEMMYSQGALYASMSGSGSAVFGIFRAAR